MPVRKRQCKTGRKIFFPLQEPGSRFLTENSRRFGNDQTQERQCVPSSSRASQAIGSRQAPMRPRIRPDSFARRKTAVRCHDPGQDPRRRAETDSRRPQRDIILSTRRRSMSGLHLWSGAVRKGARRLCQWQRHSVPSLGQRQGCL
jgi:hypothetical protein